jgi:hypothetical protein
MGAVMPLKANIQMTFRNLWLLPETDTWHEAHLMPAV